MGRHRGDVCSRIGGRDRHRAFRCHGVAVAAWCRVRTVPDIPQRAVALRTTPPGDRSWLPSHVCQPNARSEDAAVTGAFRGSGPDPVTPGARLWRRFPRRSRGRGDRATRDRSHRADPDVVEPVRRGCRGRCRRPDRRRDRLRRRTGGLAQARLPQRSGSFEPGHRHRSRGLSPCTFTPLRNWVRAITDWDRGDRTRWLEEAGVFGLWHRLSPSNSEASCAPSFPSTTWNGSRLRIP
jgi:hypothetical protein